jgi:hypothetical protein
LPRRALFGAAGIVHGIGKIVEVMVEPMVKTVEWEGDESGIVVGATESPRRACHAMRSFVSSMKA